MMVIAIAAAALVVAFLCSSSAGAMKLDHFRRSTNIEDRTIGAVNPQNRLVTTSDNAPTLTRKLPIQFPKGMAR
jgi:hypothetical protein